MTRLQTSILALLLLGPTLGCEEDQTKTVPASEVDAGPVKPAVDPNVARAMAVASAAPTAAQDGPPASGVFTPGAADGRIAKGTMPQVELGGEGSGAKIALRSLLPKPGTKQRVPVVLAFQPGPRVPPVEVRFELSFEVQKPAEGKAELPVLIQTTDVQPGPGVGGDLPKQLAQLKNSKIRYLLAEGGGALGLEVELAKGAPADLEDLLRSVAENVVASQVSFPDKPVGEGAVWMSSSRGPHQGTDALAYRMVTVKKITGDGGPSTVVELEVKSKYYAADSSIRRPGIPPGLNPVMVQFRSEGQGMILLEAGKPAPEGISNLSTAVVMHDSADTSKQMSMQGGAQVVLGDRGKQLLEAAAAAEAQQGLPSDLDVDIP
ncbi:MAG: hypothetical protein KIT72_18775 [Polyangiaceae bacterium]|nr:hypothetical protein [Polyangiaceae bacterium]MCW5792464.1 hypothetical protein [Polyangiaceae bacterium]